ncbi:YkyA family protein [Pseudoneobacillus sp. C159]
MVQMKKSLAIFFILLSNLMLLSGCFNQKAIPEKIYEIMEKVVIAEKTFETQQLPLVQAEKKEKQLYDQIISLGMKESEQIAQLADVALKSVENRAALMDSETESIEQSKQQFEEVKPLIEKLNEPELQQSAVQSYDVMMERYALHTELQSAYSKALDLDKELYNLFKNQDVTMEKLESQINEINANYKKIHKINDQFNAKTEEYNQLKLIFYQKAGLNIESKK